MNGVQTASEANAQVQSEEASLSPAQQAKLQQLKEKQKMDEQKNRHLLQGPQTQSKIQTIAEMNSVNDAKPYPYDSWTGVHGAQDSTEAQAQVQAEEASLSPSQKAKLAALQKQKEDEAKNGKN